MKSSRCCDTSIRQTTTLSLVDDALHTARIAHLVGGVPEVELGQIPGKMLAGDVVIRPVNRPLELRKEVLGLVSARTSGEVDVLALGVIDLGVGDELATQVT